MRLGIAPFFCYAVSIDWSGVRCVMPRLRVTKSPQEPKKSTVRYRSLADYLKATQQTQKQYARKLRRSQALISHLVNGGAVSRPLAARIHEDTGIPIEELMQLEEARRV